VEGEEWDSDGEFSYGDSSSEDDVDETTEKDR
jgi:hypothetical protein